jgi:Rad3-related DNA helicase
VLFGRDNYPCQVRTKQLLHDVLYNKESLKNLSGGSAKVERHIETFLNEVLLGIIKPPDNFWSESIRDMYKNKYSAMLKESTFEMVWGCISCSACKARLKETCCTHRRQYATWQKADIRVVNSSIFLTCARFDLFGTKMFEGVSRVIFDEAHTLLSFAQDTLINPELPSEPFSMQHILNVKQEYTRVRPNLFVGDIRTQDLKNQFFANPRMQKKFIFDVASKDVTITLACNPLYDLEDFRRSLFKVKCAWKRFTKKHAGDDTDEEHEFGFDEDEYGNDASELRFDDDIIQGLYTTFMATNNFLGFQTQLIELIDDPFRTIARRVAGESGIKAILSAAENILSYFDRLTLLRSACDEDGWKNSKHKYIAPTFTFDHESKEFIFAFEPTYRFGAQVLRDKLWSRTSYWQKCLMSATLQNVQNEGSPFDLFLDMIGIDTDDVTCRHSPPVFDIKTKLTFWWPNNDVFYYKMEPIRKQTLRKRVADNISHFAAQNPKMTLVVSQKDDMAFLVPLVRKQLNTCGFVVDFFENRPHLFDQPPSDDNKVVLFGSDKMCVGLNQPGRITGVLLGRKLNMMYEMHIQQYMKRVLNDDSYFQIYAYKRLSRQYQAIGRIMRSEEDFGCVGLLSHEDKEVNLLLRYYDSSNKPIVHREHPVWYAR